MNRHTQFLFNEALWLKVKINPLCLPTSYLLRKCKVPLGKEFGSKTMTTP